MHSTIVCKLNIKIGGENLVGILIVTHGEFGKQLIKSAELIVGEQENISALSLCLGDNIDELDSNIGREILKLDNGDGVIIFTDLFGGTPSNIVSRNIKEGKIYSIAGVNMPMILEILISRTSNNNLNSLVSNCIKEGTTGIIDVYKRLLD